MTKFTKVNWYSISIIMWSTATHLTLVYLNMCSRLVLLQTNCIGKVVYNYE